MLTRVPPEPSLYALSWKISLAELRGAGGKEQRRRNSESNFAEFETHRAGQSFEDLASHSFVLH
jgi:hypothetical protein